MDLSEISLASVQELHRQAETCLSGTVQLAIAADQRATTMAGIFGAGSVALLAAVATILAATSPNNPFIGGASAMAALFFVAAVTSAMAATVHWHRTGSRALSAGVHTFALQQYRFRWHRAHTENSSRRPARRNLHSGRRHYPQPVHCYRSPLATSFKSASYAAPKGDPTASAVIRRSEAMKASSFLFSARLASIAGTVCMGRVS
jgi:hypothetical protein